MPLLTYEEIADDADATANVWNVRYGRIHDLLNGRLDQANLANGAVTTAKLANGAVTSAKLGLSQIIDENGWSITDLGLVKLAMKRKDFTLPATAVNGSSFSVFAEGVNNLPVGFDEEGQYNVIHTPYMRGNVHAVGPWDLKMKEEDGVGYLKPNTPVVGTRLSGGTSTAGEQGAVETWIIF